MEPLKNPEQEAFLIVDEALATFPMEPAPESIYRAVMQQLDAAEPVPRFRIRWLDITVSVFFAGMAVFVFFLIQAPMLPHSLFPLMKVRMIVLWQQLTVALRPIDPAVFLGMLVVSLGSCLAAGWVFLRASIHRPRTAH
ncbi:MAG: hypothetical protein JXA25_11435 [Anaerolineales bacterium]|nr:hypothetical protein [Anaerolineales bacterium]